MVKDVGTLAVYLTMPRDDFSKGVSEAEKGIAMLSKSIAGFAVAAAAGITAFATASVHKFMESEAAAKQLDQTLKSTKFAAGFNSEQLKTFGNEMKSISVYGGTAINKAMALMATFTSIKGDIFKKAIESAMDLNSALGGDIQGNVIQLGKALNNPITGMTALRRVGVSFTKEQEAAVESLVNAGKLEEAQMVILNELQVEFGGQARAMSQTTQGAYLKMQNAMGGVNKEIGQMIVEGLGLVDMMNRKSASMNLVVKTLQSFDDATRNAIVRSTALALAVGSLVGAYKALIWTGLVQGITALGKYIYLCATHTTASTLNTSALWKEVQAQNALNLSRTAGLSALGMGSMGKSVQTIGKVNLSTGVVTLAAETAIATKATLPFMTALKTLPLLSFAATGALATLASSAAIAGTAFAGWKIGNWISEFTGLKDVLTDFYAKWIFGIDQIQKKSDMLDEKIKALPALASRGIMAAENTIKQQAEAAKKYIEEINKPSKFDPQSALDMRKLQDEIKIAGMADETLQEKLLIIAQKRVDIMRESTNIINATEDAKKDKEAEEKRILELQKEDVKLQIEKNKLIENERKNILEAQITLDEKLNDIKFKNATTLDEKLKLLTEKRIRAELNATYAKDEAVKLKYEGESADIEQEIKDLKKSTEDKNKYVAPRLAGAVEKGTVEAYRAELAGQNQDTAILQQTARNTDVTAKGVQQLVQSFKPFANMGVA